MHKLTDLRVTKNGNDSVNFIGSRDIYRMSNILDISAVAVITVNIFLLLYIHFSYEKGYIFRMRKVTFFVWERLHFSYEKGYIFPMRKVTFFLWERLHFSYEKGYIFPMRKVTFFLWERLHFSYEKGYIFRTRKVTFFVRERLHFSYEKGYIFRTRTVTFFVWERLHFSYEKGYIFSGLFVGENIVKLVFETFKVSLLVINHSCSFLSSLFIIVSIKSKSSASTYMFVLSANKMMQSNRFETFRKSFIYSRNSNGPRTDPWGTPHDISSVFEFILLKDTNCDLLLKYEKNRSRLFPPIP